MAKRSGSRSSRSERRAGRERAERAREHGLPTRPQATLRTRVAGPEPESQSAARSSEPTTVALKSPAIPTLVKVIGGALVILLGVYLLSRQRDQALTETPTAGESASAAASATTEPAPEPSALGPELAPSPAAESTPAPALSATLPTKPSVSLPAVPAPTKPKVAKPSVEPPPPPVLPAIHPVDAQ